MSEEDTSLMDELTAAWEEHEDGEIHEDATDEPAGEPIGLSEAVQDTAGEPSPLQPVEGGESGEINSQAGQGQVQQRKRAASSIHGTPGGEGSSAAPGDLRSTLEQAFQTANRM